MKEKKSINLLYLCMHQRLQKQADPSGIIKIKKVFELFGEIYHVHKRYWYPVLKEFIHLGLVESISNVKVKVLKCDVDLENTSKIYQRVGLF